MSRYYEMSVEIKNYDPNLVYEIQEAAQTEWSFDDDWYQDKSGKTVEPMRRRKRRRIRPPAQARHLESQQEVLRHRSHRHLPRGFATRVLLGRRRRIREG